MASTLGSTILAVLARNPSTGYMLAARHRSPSSNLRNEPLTSLGDRHPLSAVVSTTTWMASWPAPERRRR